MYFIAGFQDAYLQNSLLPVKSSVDLLNRKLTILKVKVMKITYDIGKFNITFNLLSHLD